MIQTIDTENRVKVLNEITTELSSIIGYKERLTRFAEMVVPLLADWCMVDMVTDSGEVERIVIKNHNPKSAQKLRKINQIYGIVRKGWLSKALISGRVQIIDDLNKTTLRNMKLDEEHVDKITSLGIGPGMVAVLEARGKKLGTVTIMRDANKEPYKKDDVEFVKILTAQVGILIDNSLLLAKANQELFEQKKARKALQDSEATLRMALNAGRMGIWDWQINTGKVRLSRDSEFLYGFGEGKFGGGLQELIDKIDEVDRIRALDEIKHAVMEKGNYISEYRIGKREGEIKWLMSVGKVICDKTGAPSRMLGVVSDITNRKMAEESMKLSERKFKLIFQNAMDTIMIADRHGRILDVNPAGTKLWGKPVEEMMKLRMSDLVGEKREEIIDKWKNLPEQETQVGEIVMNNAKGIPKTLEYAATANILPFQDLFIFRDITDRVIEDKRREHFLSIASHELRSPLASIKAFNYLIKKIPGMDTNQKAAEYLNKIDDKVDTVARLIGDLLDVTRIRQGKMEMVPEEFDFDQFVNDVIEDMKMTVKTHKIIKSGKTGQRVVADKKKIAQVLINLVRNAIKYSPQTKRVEVKLSKKGDEVGVAVKDYGMGIAKLDKDKIFELYYRGGDERKEGIRGLGVGLYISQQIINQHRGRIWVESQKNKGSVFYFTIPITYV